MSEEKVICPVCKQVVLDFEECINEPCEHVMLIYTDALNCEFVHEDDSMEKDAKKMVAKYVSGEEDKSLDMLMEEYVEKNADLDLVILEMTTYGMACGPCSNTDYVMFKLGK